MKKFFFKPELFLTVGLIMILPSYFTDIFWIKVTLVPIGLIMILIFAFLSVKGILNEKKLGKDNEQKDASIRINVKTLGYILMSLFSSMLALVFIFVLFMFFSIEKIEMWRIYLILIAIVYAVLMIISTIALFRYLYKKTGVN